jgi:hypothetical protein
MAEQPSELAQIAARLDTIDVALAEIARQFQESDGLLPQLYEVAQKQNQSYMELIQAIRQEMRVTRAAVRLAVSAAGLEHGQARPIPGPPAGAGDLGRCARCGAPLDNVAPGFSVTTSGLTVCANCVAPGEELLRARAIEVGKG